MKTLAVVSALMLVWSWQTTQAQQLYKPLYGSPKCRDSYYTGMVPPQFQFQGGFMMWIDVEDWRRLEDASFREQVLESAFQANLSYCKARGQRASIAEVTVTLPGRGAILEAWTSATDRSWHVTLDKVPAVIADMEAQRQRREAELERQRRREEAARKAQEEKQKAEQQLIAKEEARTAELKKVAQEDAEQRDKVHPADSFCFFSCDPRERDARGALQNRLQALIRTPVIVMKFRKTNSARANVAGHAVYQLYYQADVEFPQGFIRRPKSIWDEIQGGSQGMMIATELKELFNFKITNEGKKLWDPQSLTVSGQVPFQKTEKGWLAFDGHVY